MNSSYPKLIDLQKPLMVKENEAVYSFLNERHIHVIWYEQKYFKDLKTADGQSIKVISPGIWNLAPGPDFLKAELEIEGKIIKGDIEIHLFDENWTQHNHHEDERYNSVIFHLSLWKPNRFSLITKKNGEQVICGHLESFLTIAHSRILQLIDLDLYPYKKFIGSGKCASNVFLSLSNDKIENLMQSAAYWRLNQKAKHLKSLFAPSSFQFGGGIAGALGYKNNTEAFQKLYKQLLNQRDLPEPELISLSLGICGFFEKRFRDKWNQSNYYNELLQKFEKINHKNLEKITLNFTQIRPLNHPIRRLVYLTKFLLNPDYENIYISMQKQWANDFLENASKKHWISLNGKLLNLIPDIKDLYWNSHYLFEPIPKKNYLALLGKDVKAEILVNVFFPLLLEDILARGSQKELQAFTIFFSTIPASNTGKTKYLQHRFFGNSSKGSLLKKAQYEQAAYQLHKDFCIHYEASCVGCPFVDKVKTIFKIK